MTKYLVSISGGPAVETLVRPRTQKIAPGVLCEVAIDGRFELCLVDCVGTMVIDVRPLPCARELRSPGRNQPRKGDGVIEAVDPRLHDLRRIESI